MYIRCELQTTNSDQGEAVVEEYDNFNNKNSKRNIILLAVKQHRQK